VLRRSIIGNTWGELPMGVIENLLQDVALPRMAPVRQIFPDNAIADVEAELRAEFRQPAIEALVKPGASIAIGVGSRGIAELPLLARIVVDELKRRGARPFIVPAMGSHGGATDEGQAALLAALGVTEESAGCPVVSSMETLELGRLPNGLAVLMDAKAMKADGIVVINRIKPHTSFSGRIESGILKMIAIGLGKQKGADACHRLGMGVMGQNILDMAEVKLAKSPILFGVGTVENGYDRICRVAVIPAPEIVEREAELNPLDVLVVDRMGKEYSGTGMDPNITGRAGTPYVQTELRAARLVILDLSEKTKGNATGVGLADICTRRLFEKIDFGATYMNHITSTVLPGGKIPVMMNSDRHAVQCAVKTCNAPDMDRLRVVRIPNTLHLETLLISEALLEEAKANPKIEVLSVPEEWSFDADGTVATF
jgi:hypothetical protein